MDIVTRNWLKVVVWAVVLGLVVSLIADWGRWDHLPFNLVWRVLITAAGGIIGLVLNFFAGNYVGMGTNIIESMGVVKFSDDTHQKIENSFIFVGSLVAAILAALFVR